MRVSNRLRHVLSPTRFSAAEAILGATALVLLIWLFWPEATTPKLDQRATWQKHLRDAEHQRSQELADRRPVLEPEIAIENPEEPAFRAKAAQQRVVLAKPSELADRFSRRARETAAEDVAKPIARPALPLDQQDVVSDQQDDDVPPAEEALPPVDVDVAVSSSEALDSAQEPEETVSGTPPSLDGFAVESAASSHVSQRPRDDTPSWLKNAVASSLVDERPVIAVVIDDLGLNRAGTKALNQLPAPLTLAFLPYAGNIEAQTEAARQAGHELMVHIPMEPFGTEWPGPEALITSLSRDEFVRRLEFNLNRIKGYVGVNNHMGSRLTADPGRMDLVMRTLRDRDVLFLDSKTSSRSVASEMANRNGVPNTVRDVFLDHVIDIEKIRNQMSLIERIARQSGSAVAIGHPHAATIEALRGWLPTLAARGFVLAPISAVVARRACRDELLITAETCGRYLQAGTPNSSLATAVGG